MNPCRLDASICRANVGVAVMRRRVVVAAGCANDGSAISMLRIGLADSRYFAPASVRRIALLRRSNSSAPTSSSSPFTRLRIALAVRLNSRAARSKLPSRATASNPRSASVDGMRTQPRLLCCSICISPSLPRPVCRSCIQGRIVYGDAALNRVEIPTTAHTNAR